MKTLKARDCNQRERKTEVTQQQAAVTVLYLPKRKKKKKKSLVSVRMGFRWPLLSSVQQQEGQKK